MPGAPQTVRVDVRIFNPAPGVIDFELLSGIASGPKTLNFRNNGHPGFIVMFDIKNQAAVAYEFPANPADALWVKPVVVPAVPAAGGAAAAPNDTCPDGPCVWSQFEAQAVAGDRETLVVRNRNEFTQKFGFVLRVTDPAGAAGNILNLDPIGNNQNGPQ